MKKSGMVKLPALLLALTLLLTACADKPRLRNIPTYQYTSASGYHLLLPEDWQLAEEQKDSAVFYATEGQVSLTVVDELGGEAYYGLDEITQMLLERLPADAPSWQEGRVITDTEEKRRQVFTGQDEDGATVCLDITVLQPYPGIRYYLLFAAGSAAYFEQSALMGEIVESFGLDEEVPYLYALMEERRAGEEKGL